MAKNGTAGFHNPYQELTQRLLYLLMALVVYRIGAHIPVPGVNLEKIAEIFNSEKGSIFQFFNMFSGGALSNASMLALGVAPYISASIVMQILSHMYGPLKELRAEGSTGQKKINYRTRWLTLILAIGQGYALSTTVMGSGMTLMSGPAWLLISTIALATGAMFMMWLGEQITERGIGNGISMLIFAGIAVNMPASISSLVSQAKVGDISFARFFLTLAIIIGLFALIVYVERAQRRIPIHYAKRQMYGQQSALGQATHLPLKINMPGVIPAIFASAMITLAITVLALGINTQGKMGQIISQVYNGFNHGQPLYIALFGLLIVLFSFFYTSMVFENKELAENLKKSNAFIQGFRPGKQTADYLDMVQERLTLVGGCYVAFVCILPSILNMGSASGHVLFLFGGTSLLIAVVVAMDFVAQVQSHIMSRRYESMMKKANLAGFGHSQRRVK